MSYPALDPWQYRLGRDLPAGRALSGGWKLEVGADLPVTEMRDAVGAQIGYLLGFPIDLEQRCLIGPEWQTSATLAGDVDAFADQVLLQLGGRFLWVFTTQVVQRLYPDCMGQVSCVYDTRGKIAGSTAHALFDDAIYEKRFDTDFYTKLGVDGEGWFPCELTAHYDLFRLFPNNYLDLETFISVRSWPRVESRMERAPEELVSAFIDIVQAQIEALVDGPKKVALALTAGLDSRTVLACAKPFRDQISCFTVLGNDRHALDSVMSKRITSEIGLQHIALPRKSATPEQRDLFIRRGGHCNGDSNSIYHPTVWPLKDDYVFVGGAGGEVARPPVYRKTDTSETILSTEQLILRLGLQTHPQLVDALKQRLAKQPKGDVFDTLDLLFLEDRYCAWYAAQFCCDPTLVRHAPLITTSTVRMMMELPSYWKQSDRFERAVIRQAWPELDHFPYNSLGWFWDHWIKLQRVLADPSIIAKKLRKLRT